MSRRLVLVAATLLVSTGTSMFVFAQDSAISSQASPIATERLRELTKRIRLCRDSEEHNADGSGYHVETPQNVIWKIEAADYSQSQQIGVVEFVQHQIYVPRPLEQCKKRDSNCQTRNLNAKQFNAIMFGVDMPDQFRFEFELSSNGIDLARSLAKHQTEDKRHWVADKPRLGCIAAAVKSASGEALNQSSGTE